MNDKNIDDDYFLKIVSDMGEGVCVTDARGNVEFANRAANALLNLENHNSTQPNLYKQLNVAAERQHEISERVINRGLTIRGDDWQLKGGSGRPVMIGYVVSRAPEPQKKPQLIFLLSDISRRNQLERRLIKREQQLEMAQRRTNLGSWDWDLITEVVTWTAEMYRIFGYAPNEIEPSFNSTLKHIHPEDRPEVEAQIFQAVQNKAPFRFTSRLLQKDGTERVILVYGSTRLGDQGAVIHLWGTTQDITEVHELTQARDQTQRFSELLIDSSQQGLAVLDKSLRFVVWSRKMEELTGIKEEELLGIAVSDFFPEILDEEQTDVLEYLYRMIAGEEIEQVEYEFPHRENGEIYQVEVNYWPLLDEIGEIAGGLIVARDVTKRKKVLQELDRRKARSQAIFKAAGLGILLFDTDRLILEANPAWEEMSGFPVASLLNQDFAGFLWPEDQEALRDGLSELLEGQRPFLQQEMRGRTSRGETMWLSGSFTRLNDEDGRPRRIVCIVENITMRKEMERELTTVKRELARSREKERVFMAQELHDGPIQDLYATTYQLQALKRVIVGEKSATLVENVLQQFNQVNETLRTICNDLRPPTLATFGLGSAVRSHAERFQKLYPDLTISLELQQDDLNLPEYVRLTLFRITQEMLSNIAKHAEATQVLIRFELNVSDLVLEIQDNGNGFRVPDRWIELVREGHLGLLGASERAEEIDGSLTILSTPGSGTVVRVVAPRPDGEPDQRSLAN